MRASVFRQLCPRATLLALLLILAATTGSRPASAATKPAAPGPKQVLAYGQLLQSSKSRQQDPNWVKLKLANKVARPGMSVLQIPAAYPASYQLDTTYVKGISEPPPTGRDAAGNSYTDYYFWYLCGPGATTVAMDYWPIPNNRHYGDHNFSDPHTTTNWNDAGYRAYMMYIADNVRPPWYTSNGEMTYGTYSNADTTFDDLRDAMNWEASGHASNWSTYFYLVVGAGSLNSTTVHNDLRSDIVNYHVPAVVSINDAYLPDWRNGHTSHFVSIIGYDDSKGTYTYAETCTTASCNTTGSGIYTVSQQQLYNGIQNDSGNGGIVW